MFIHYTTAAKFGQISKSFALKAQHGNRLAIYNKAAVWLTTSEEFEPSILVRGRVLQYVPGHYIKPDKTPLETFHIRFIIKENALKHGFVKLVTWKDFIADGGMIKELAYAHASYARSVGADTNDWWLSYKDISTSYCQCEAWDGVSWVSIYELQNILTNGGRSDAVLDVCRNLLTNEQIIELQSVSV